MNVYIQIIKFTGAVSRVVSQAEYIYPDLLPGMNNTRNLKKNTTFRHCRFINSE